MRLAQSRSKAPEEVARIISDGGNGMPPWKGKLQPQEIRALAEYARTLAR
jgi:mono/diheme cytochrome c family protein